MSRPSRAADRAVGVVTRETTNPNRLRRIDRFLAGPCAPVLLAASDPLVVDLGYGASPVTTIELARRLRAVRPDAEVIGVEIDPERVAAGEAASQTVGERVRFVRAGFEMGGATLGGRRPCLVRAANVLRQYDESQVSDAWALMVSRLSTGGLVIDATCDEIGRIGSWAVVAAGGRGGDAMEARPVSLTVSYRLAGLERPGLVAARLPKALIHRNVAGEWVHTWLEAMDAAWAHAAPHAGFGARQRFLTMASALRDKGLPVLDGPSRWRLGELTVAWGAVAE